MSEDVMPDIERSSGNRRPRAVVTTRSGTFSVKPEGTWFVAHVVEGTRLAAEGRGATETAALRAAFSDYIQQMADA